MLLKNRALACIATLLLVLVCGAKGESQREPSSQTATNTPTPLTTFLKRTLPPPTTSPTPSIDATSSRIPTGGNDSVLSSSGLGSGQKIGIIGSAGTLILCILAVAYCVAMRRLRKKWGLGAGEVGFIGSRGSEIEEGKGSSSGLEEGRGGNELETDEVRGRKLGQERGRFGVGIVVEEAILMDGGAKMEKKGSCGSIEVDMKIGVLSEGFEKRGA